MTQQNFTVHMCMLFEAHVLMGLEKPMNTKNLNNLRATGY